MSEIKILNLADIPECLEMISQWHHSEWGYLNPGRTLEMRLNSMQEHLKGKEIPTTYVATIDGCVVGSAALKVTDMPEKPECTPWLGSVFVSPSARKNGVGRLLVKQIMKHANNIGVKTIYLYTPDREHFYLHLGWETIEKITYHDTLVTLMKFDF